MLMELVSNDPQFAVSKFTAKFTQKNVKKTLKIWIKITSELNAILGTEMEKGNFDYMYLLH